MESVKKVHVTFSSFWLVAVLDVLALGLMTPTEVKADASYSGDITFTFTPQAENGLTISNPDYVLSDRPGTANGSAWVSGYAISNEVNIAGASYLPFGSSTIDRSTDVNYTLNNTSGGNLAVSINYSYSYSAQTKIDDPAEDSAEMTLAIGYYDTELNRTMIFILPKTYLVGNASVPLTKPTGVWPVTIPTGSTAITIEPYLYGSCTTVPEPSAPILLGLGAIGLLARRRRAA